MRQFMTHSNHTPVALSTHTSEVTTRYARPLQAGDYVVVRSRRKTMSLHVRHERVEVRVPVYVGDAEVARFVATHQAWIERKLEEKASQHAQRLQLVEGGVIFYKGKSLRVRLTRAMNERIEIAGNEFCLYCRQLDGSGPSRALARCLTEEAKSRLPARARALADYLGVGEKLKEVVFRKTKTKWGHCTTSGRIQFNWLIMLAPDAIIDYMICHEVSHLRVMNHSPKFWALVESVCPDYRRYVRWLRQHEHRLWL